MKQKDLDKNLSHLNTNNETPWIKPDKLPEEDRQKCLAVSKLGYVFIAFWYECYGCFMDTKDYESGFPPALIRCWMPIVVPEN